YPVHTPKIVALETHQGNLEGRAAIRACLRSFAIGSGLTTGGLELSVALAGCLASLGLVTPAPLLLNTF
ncbi:hypothetical protein, partial [Olavius algarvensis spirochete endosymbiont]|uniref:hypothetical protein n=1 Tax=Olavius algarvensis spirochete endosymbiont TaxID=260710 RepID=UPI001E34ED13